MELVLFVIRLVLAATFLLAGLSKLSDHSGSRQSMIDFGIAPLLAGPLGIALPLVELLIGAGLLFSVTARWGALGATGLLTIFIVAIGINLGRGRAPDCHCFGQLHTTRIGWPTLLRNGMLTLASASVALQGPGSASAATGVIEELSAAETVAMVMLLILSVAVIGQGWFMWNLFRQNGRLLVRLDALEAGLGPPEGLPLGAPAPEFRLPSLGGGETTLDSLCQEGKPLMLIFWEPDCGPCRELVSDMAGWYAAMSDVSVAFVSRGSVEKNRAVIGEQDLVPLLLQQDLEVFSGYRAMGTPSGIIVRPDKTIGSGVAGGVEAIQSLLREVVEEERGSAEANAKPRTHEVDIPSRSG